MASSDNHYARPGTGYKERFRRGNTESSAGARPEGLLAEGLRAPEDEPVANPRPFDPEDTDLAAFQLVELERQGSFFMTGGLIAAHAEGRDRRSIWEAMARREVYATSGPRILLWFEMLNAPGSRGETVSMGGEVGMAEAPIFRVRAVGSFEQRPGCPDHARQGLPIDSLERLCKGECYHPGETRRPITRIEVARIRPQIRPGELLEYLIDDPWLTFPCEGDGTGCVATFTDAEFLGQRRDTVYYVRAYEAPTPAINAAGANCTFDEDGRCTEARLCSGADGDCLAPHEPRAWSSPIYVDFAPPRGDGSEERALAQNRLGMR